jgi:uroporphyrinogen decarboxylase
MTSRERVRLAFQHREPDRVPIYEQSICCRVASEIMGRRMRTGGGRLRFEETEARWESEEAWRDYVGRVTEDVGDLIRALDFDIVGMPWRHSSRPSRKLDDRTFRYDDADTGIWSVFHYEDVTDVFDEVDSAIAREGAAAIERLVAAMERDAPQARPPTAEDYAEPHALAARAGGERALKSGVGFISIPPTSAWLETAALRPDLIERYLDVVAHQAIVAMPALPGLGIDLLWAGGDLAGTGGPIYSPAMLRRFLLPRLRKIVDAAHAAGLPYLFRTDGNIWSIAQELLVESGVDGYGEIDIDAGMDLAALKRRFPQLTLWGGVSCGSALVFASPGAIRDEVRWVMAACKPGGGLILGSSNSIHTGIPTSNFLSMFEAARDFGRYH